MTNPNLYVITGGPGSGKTTLIRELEASRQLCVAEVAREIIQEQVAIGGDALPWANREAYTRLMLDRSIASFLAQPLEPPARFADRGIPDTLCYARLIGLEQTTEIDAACRRYRYASKVFIAPPWKEIYSTDRERRQGWKEAVRTFELMSQVYEECGYLLIELPRIPVRERADFLMDQARAVPQLFD